jgi:hypothetical protein
MIDDTALRVESLAQKLNIYSLKLSTRDHKARYASK